MASKIKLTSYAFSRAYNTPLLLEPGKARVISEYLQSRMDMEWENNNDIPPKEKKPEDATILVQKVAIIPVIGTLVHRGGWMDADSGLLSYQNLRQQLISVANDPSVSSILLDIDSGGGEVEGNFELARLIREINNNHKPVFALANGSAFSGAFSIGSAAGQFFVTSTGGVGSVGVIMQHVDVSRNNEINGIKVTNIVSGEHKADFSSDFPLSESAKNTLQKEVDRTADMFISLISELRGIPDPIIRGTEAALLFGQDAVNIGFVDGIISFDDLLETMVGTDFTSNPKRIQDMFLKKKTEVEKSAEETIVETPAAETDPVEVETPPVETEKEKEPDALEVAAEIADICHKAGMSHMASGFIKSKMTIEDVKAKVDLNKQIEQVCKLAGKSDLAKGYIESGKPLKEIQNDLISKMSEKQTDISNKENPDEVAKSVSAAKNVIMEDIERRNKKVKGE